MKKEALKKENKRIHRKSIEHNFTHKKECSFYNWKARIVGFLDFDKGVWPQPSNTEVEAFINQTGFISSSIKLKGGNKKNVNK